jgi:hypothetical protein
MGTAEGEYMLTGKNIGAKQKGAQVDDRIDDVEEPHYVSLHHAGD